MDAPEYFDVMVDIETTGTNPEHGGIIQISAVRFNFDEETVDGADMFDRCLSVAPGRYWDESTRSWWHGKNSKVLNLINSRMEDPAVVLKDFQQWVGTTPKQPLRFWSKPTTFDFMFLSSYFRQYDLFNPFHYRFARDLNSFLAGLARDPNVTEKEVGAEFTGAAHNALHDVLHQIKVLFQAKQVLRG